MLDMWTDVFASPGWRTTGTQAGTFLVTPPGWRPDLRDRFIDEFKLPKNTQRIDAPTPYVWIIGRTKTDGPPDYEAVRKIQAGFQVTVLSEWGKTPKPPELKNNPSVDMTTPPREQVDTMPVGRYFAYAADWASPCGVEGSVRNPSTPGGWNGTETSPEAVHPRV
jgi:hypothetical protein